MNSSLLGLVSTLLLENLNLILILIQIYIQDTPVYITFLFP